MMVFEHATTSDHFVEDKVRLFEIKHDIELADRFKVLVEAAPRLGSGGVGRVLDSRFNKGVNEFENAQLILSILLRANDEEERRVSPINDLFHRDLNTSPQAHIRRTL